MAESQRRITPSTPSRHMTSGGVLRINGLTRERDVPTLDDAVKQLALEIVKVERHPVQLTAPAYAPNRLLLPVHMGSVLYHFVLPVVKTFAFGDEQLFIAVATMLERYVRTPRWFDSEDDEPRTPEPRRAPRTVVPSPHTPLDALRSSSPPLDDNGGWSSDDDDDELMVMRQRAHYGDVASQREVDDPPRALIEAAVVALRLASVAIFSDDRADKYQWYTTFVDSALRDMASSVKVRRWLSRTNPKALQRREMQLLRALDYVIDTPTLFDFWSLLDEIMWTPAQERVFERAFTEAEKHTAATFATALLVYAQLDRRLASAATPLSVAVTAAAITLVANDAMVGRDQAPVAMARTLYVVSGAFAQYEGKDDDDEGGGVTPDFRLAVARLITVRATALLAGARAFVADDDRFSSLFVNALRRSAVTSEVLAHFKTFAGMGALDAEFARHPILAKNPLLARLPEGEERVRRIVEFTYPPRNTIDFEAFADYVRNTSDFTSSTDTAPRAKRRR